ncbi:RNA polymerase factor sigma-54 [Roseospira navarrensis]|uniref:RNA polymerase sigma-54 factor n=1 Tax=Roseospira navarrensis TaxID=140058 RepID=A0A7X1ZFC9_9PROT|nr:RNA polymerase factor sigma-54 [Roseospira navarrensis]MQX37481.1 RNA polymerase factor sigma-54 [Roseospira navarrensis]
MGLSPRLDLRQAQSLVMTPQLQQAIKLLQMSNLDLTAYVEQELERNPLLERDERAAFDTPPERAEVRPDAESAVIVDRGGGEGADGPSPLDQDYNTDRDEAGAGDMAGPVNGDAEGGLDALGLSLGAWGGGGGGSRDFMDDERGLEETLSRPESLREHLSEQIALDLDDPADRLIATHLLGLLDACGYLTASVAEVAATLGAPEDQVAGVLARLQRCDPPGLFARSLKECLALQLADRNRLDPAMVALLDNLDLLARRDMAALMRVCGVDAEDLREMIAEVRALDPKPALRFEGEPIQTVVPDVVMRPNPEGGWVIELNADTLPRVLVNRRYLARVKPAAKGDKAVQAFLGESLQTANWLVKALDQRATTIIKVAGEIVRQQDAFLAHGIQHLRPLILRDVASVIGMHESTVSRVTSNKYIATPRGLIELKYFFTQAINSSAGGEAHSAEAVRARIKALIDAEPPAKVLSDDRIVTILKGEGVDIARRTVAKYRESLRIPSSVQRRREKMAMAGG